MMTPEQIFDMAMKEAELRVSLKPMVETILEDPYKAALEMVKMYAIIQKYKDTYGDI
jgi:hypothetical protein